MGNRRISTDIKECALGLWERGWEKPDICDALGISLSSLLRWQDIFEEHGSVIRPPSPLRGRQRIITRAVLSAIQDVYRTDPDIYLDELVLWLAINYNIAISSSALHKNLVDVGLTRKVMQKIAAERDEVRREEFRMLLQSKDFRGDGSEFVCLDETSKNELSYARTHGRALSGERAVFTDVFVRGDRYSILAALSLNGYIAVDIVPGSYDSLQFYEFIQEQVVVSTLFYLRRYSYPQASTNEPIS